MRETSSVVRRQTNQLEEVGHLGLVVTLHLLDPKRFGDRRPDGQTRIERRLRILEHDLHLAAQRPHLTPIERGDVGALELDRARRGLDQTQQTPTDGCLAAAALTDEAERLAGGDVERHP